MEGGLMIPPIPKYLSLDIDDFTPLEILLAAAQIEGI